MIRRGSEWDTVNSTWFVWPITHWPNAPALYGTTFRLFYSWNNGTCETLYLLSLLIVILAFFMQSLVSFARNCCLMDEVFVPKGFARFSESRFFARLGIWRNTSVGVWIWGDLRTLTLTHF